MSSQFDDNLLDAIVAGVLDRLRGASAPSGSSRRDMERGNGVDRGGEARAVTAAEPPLISSRVVTEAVLEASLHGAKTVRFAPKTVLTPTARDYLRVHGIDWSYATSEPSRSQTLDGGWAVLIVRSTTAVERVVAELFPDARRERFSCPDDAATFAIAERARGGFARGILFAEQTHRAACLANRHTAVKAAAVRDAAEVVSIGRQLRVNVWCLDPTNRTYFELRNVLKALR
jgi:hypothetical protein